MSRDGGTTMGNGNRKAITRIVDGWPVTMDGDEPTIPDEELGARLGFSEPRMIRKLIRRMIAAGFLNSSDIRATVSQNAGQRGRPGTAYLLTETGALLVIGRSDTKIAHTITRQIVRVFIEVRQGQLAAQQAVPQQVPVLSTSPIVGDSRFHRADMAAWCKMAARNNSVSLQRIHGEVRRQFRVAGVNLLPVVLYERALELIKAIALGHLMLPSRAKRRLALVADPAQGVLPFPGAQR